MGNEAEPLNEMPRLHPRVKVVDKAKQAVRRALSEFALTPGEEARMLAGMAADAAKYCVRHERHGDYSTRADEAARHEQEGEEDCSIAPHQEFLVRAVSVLLAMTGSQSHVDRAIKSEFGRLRRRVEELEADDA